MPKNKNEIIHVKKQVEPQSPVLVLNTGKPKRRVHKIGIRERKIIFESLLDEFNLAKAAAKVGVTYNALKKLIDRDEQVRESVEQIEQAWLQNHVGVAYKVGSIPTREGATDRWKMLEARLPQQFGRKLDVSVNAKITHETAIPELSRILDRFGYSKIESRQDTGVEDADFLEINAPEQA